MILSFSLDGRKEGQGQKMGDCKPMSITELFFSVSNFQRYLALEIKDIRHED